MPLTPIEVDLVEKLAQEQVRYETIHKDQRDILKTNQNEFDQARARLEQSSAVVKPGQRFQPAPDQVDQYLAQCDATCRSTPQNVDDRVKIMYSAHTAVVYIIMFKFSLQRFEVQLAILKRRRELQLSRPRRPPPSPITNEAPLSKRSVEPRCLTSEDICLFQNPEELYGKQFILSPNSVDSEIVEIIGYSRMREETVTFDLLFDGCEGPVSVDAEELMGLLKSSLYFPG